MNFIGIDIGGTKTAVCTGDENGHIAASERIPTDSKEPMDLYYERLASLCNGVLNRASLSPADITAVGISAPGPLDVKKGILIAPPNNPGWHNVPIVEAMSERLQKPVFLNHDAKSCALAEFYFGGHGVQNLLYLTCSTGMGGGIIANGRIVQGITDAGGEVGHHVIQRDGLPCGCGKRGCWEAYVGGWNVANQVREKIRSGRIPTAILQKAGGDPDRIDFKTITDAAREDDPFAVEVCEEFTDRMAQGIGNLIMILNPELVVLGTFAIREGEFLMKPLREKLGRYVWKWPLEACRITPSRLGSRIGDLAALAVAIAAVRGNAASAENP
jgi:glucokinase